MAVSKLSRLLFLLVILCTFCFGQGQAGTPPFSSWSGEVNINALNLLLDVPVRSKPGGIPFSYHLISNNFATFSPPASVWAINPRFVGSLSGSGTLSHGQSRDMCPDGVTITQDEINWAFTDRNGTVHLFGGGGALTDTQGCLFGTTATAGPDDHTGYKLVITGATNGTVYDRSGNKTASTSIIDPNGNQVSLAGNVWTDTLGATALTITPTNGSGSPDKYSYTDFNGGTQTVQVNYTNYTQQTNFGCSTGVEISPTSVYFPSSISLPDGSNYVITYEITPGDAHTPHYVTGRIASIKIPTGATITYAYSGGSNGVNCLLGTVNTLTKTTPDGQWKYVHTDPPSRASVISTTTVTDPLLNQTTYTFSGPYEVQRVVKDSSNNTLVTTTTCYNGNLSNCASVTVTGPITERDEYVLWQGQTVSSRSMTAYNANSLPTAKKFYANGSALTNYTAFAYYDGLPNSCNTLSSGSYIVDRPCSLYVYDGNNATQAISAFQYDPNGNRLQSSVWTGSLWLPTTISPNANGTVFSSTSPTGDVTGFSYGCGNGHMVTGISHTTGSLSSSFVPNCDGGVNTSSTDMNGKTSSVNFAGDGADPFWRPETATDRTGVVTTFDYTPTTGESAITFNSGGSTVHGKSFVDSLGRTYNSQTLRAPGSSTWDTVTTAYDVIGRVHVQTLPCAVGAGVICSLSGPAVTTLYDALGRTTSVSDGHGDSVTYTYTPATVTRNNVVINVVDVLVSGAGKTTNNEYDGLGRLISVCEVSSQSGNAPCGQAVGKNGFLTSYSYNTIGNLLSVTQGIQTRTFQYDMLGRLLTENNPENGLTQYFYESGALVPGAPGAACPGTYNGSLVKRYDANGNTTCYTYDNLGRVLSISYSGPNDNGTNKYFVYDGATVNGQVMANAAGRLARAYTAASQGGTKITDEGFSYSARGELTDVYQSSPNSGGYYHTSATYFENGAISGLSGVGRSWTFGVDGKGRPQTAWINGPPVTENEVTNVTYDAADRPLVVTMGLGDTDTYVYDASTGHLNSWTFSVGATPTTLKGTLGYSATNGLVTALGVVDGFNNVNSQNCTYGYDDMARTNSANCGSSDWNQTFSYDRYGNVTKTGNPGITWNPGYTSGTNRYLGASTYDANGNLKFDTFHNYTWNTDNKPVTIDGTTITYDAFNNPVEKTISGVTTEILYTPLGKTATMSGQSVVKLFMPLPGGVGFESVSGVTSALYHHKDGLGSSRFVSTRSPRASYYDVSYAPFGEDYNGAGTSAELNFTDRRQDLVAGTYDFPAREYNPRQGRWISPDPAGIGSAHPSDPQTWNRYAYVSNNPLANTDPSGLEENNFGGDEVSFQNDGGDIFSAVEDADEGAFILDGLLGQPFTINLSFPGDSSSGSSSSGEGNGMLGTDKGSLADQGLSYLGRMLDYRGPHGTGIPLGAQLGLLTGGGMGASGESLAVRTERALSRECYFCTTSSPVQGTVEGIVPNSHYVRATLNMHYDGVSSASNALEGWLSGQDIRVSIWENGGKDLRNRFADLNARATNGGEYGVGRFHLSANDIDVIKLDPRGWNTGNDVPKMFKLGTPRRTASDATWFYRRNGD